MRKGKDPEPVPHLWLMDPDPGGSKTWIRIPNTGLKSVECLEMWERRGGGGGWRRGRGVGAGDPAQDSPHQHLQDNKEYHSGRQVSYAVHPAEPVFKIIRWKIPVVRYLPSRASRHEESTLSLDTVPCSWKRDRFFKKSVYLPPILHRVDSFPHFFILNTGSG